MDLPLNGSDCFRCAVDECPKEFVCGHVLNAACAFKFAKKEGLATCNRCVTLNVHRLRQSHCTPANITGFCVPPDYNSGNPEQFAVELE
jgi:hypothetical protein